MAEAKYDLCLIKTRSDTKMVYNQPWYKERLKTKFMKEKRRGDLSKFLNGENWTFIKDGLDDFRDGLPPIVDGSSVLSNNKGLSPNLTGLPSRLSSIKQNASRKRLTPHQICYSRVTPQQQQRRQHIAEIEYGLTQHPLALYPHLEECLPPDLFEDIVDILDPEMNVALEEEDDDEDYPDEYEEDNNTVVAETLSTLKPEAAVPATSRSEDKALARNPYRWLPRKEEKDKKDRRKTFERHNSAQNEHIKKVTTDFCDWVASLGGEQNNIEETTVTSLFASGYETKPALSVPIHVVELTNVPPELRASATVPVAADQDTKNIPSRDDESEKDKLEQKGYKKFKYGSWYLPTSTWKKREFDEPLQDPEKLKQQEASESRKRSEALDTEMSQTHGAHAFMDFIDRKSCRKPEFLSRVAKIQAAQAKEDAAKAALEAARTNRFK